jgi:hypothetical protein
MRSSIFFLAGVLVTGVVARAGDMSVPHPAPTAECTYSRAAEAARSGPAVSSSAASRSTSPARSRLRRRQGLRRRHDARQAREEIDELLASDAFVDRWTMWFGDLVQNVQVASNTREYYRPQRLLQLHERLDQGPQAVRPDGARAHRRQGRQLHVGEANYSSASSSRTVRSRTRTTTSRRTGRALPRHAAAVPLLPQRPRPSRAGQQRYLASKKRATILVATPAFFARTRARAAA